MATLFSQRHYKKIAELLKESIDRPFVNLSTLDDIFDKFAREFERDNPRFDYSKFHKAVWEGGEVR